MKRFLLIFVIIFQLIVPLSAGAQGSSNQSLEVEGLRINPFIIEVDASAGSTVTKTIELTNTTQESIPFVASINDFVPNGNTGQALFLDSDKESDPRFSLSKWLTITKQPSFTIPQNESTKVEFSINVPADAEPGTHYGGILFGKPPQKVTTESATAVQQKVGAIILVKLGKSLQDISLTEFRPIKTFFLNRNILFKTTLSNNGNVHSKARGEITIKDIFGRQIIQVPINRDSQIILPQTHRDFISQWNPKLPFGRYTTDVVIYYGNPKLELQAHGSFWVIPVKEISLGVLILLILGIMIYIGIKQYNHYIIKNSQ